MDPKELKRLHEQKKAQTAAQIAQVNAAQSAAQVELKQKMADGSTALKEAVLPYFQEVATAFDKGEFVIETKLDESGRSLVGVSFKIGSGPEYGIEAMGGKIRAWKRYPGTKSEPRPIYFFPAQHEPFIGNITDLTREKLEKLVQQAIKDG
jgi:hypothetical protein